MPRARSLEWKLPLMVGGLVTLIIAAALLLGFEAVRHGTHEFAIERITAVSDQLRTGLAAQAAGHVAREVELARDPLVRDALARRDSASLVAVQARLFATPQIIAARLLDANGAVVWEGGPGLAAVTGLGPLNLRTTVYGSDSAGVGRFSAVGDTLVFPLVAMVRYDTARVGYLVRWSAIVPNPAARDAVAGLIGLQARLFIGSPGGAWSDQAEVVDAPPIPVESLTASNSYLRTELGQQLAVGIMIPGAPWAIVTEFPHDVVMAPAYRFLRRAAIASTFLLGAGLLVGVWASRRVTRPLRMLTEAAGAMGLEDRHVRVTGRDGDEIGQLGQAFNRMAERVEAEAAARMGAETQWRLLFAENPFPMWVVDLETLGFLAVNEASVERYGWTPEEWATMTLRDIRPAEDLEAMQVTLDQYAGGGMRAALVRHRDRAGRIFDVELNGREVTFQGRHARLVMGLDVSERHALEAQLRQAQRLEAVGRLAGGVAHDFNNNLAVISACVEMMMSDLVAAGRATDLAEEILRAANRAHVLTRQLLAFSRQQVTRPVVMNPNRAVRSVEQMISRIIEEDVEIVVRTAPDLPAVRIDPGQLEQVLMNLAVNARDALPHGGEITMITAAREVDQDSIALYGLREPGAYVVISISDNGTGMTPEVRAKIFDPFFTTKEAGQGTGLGLSTAYGIVAAAGGAISVYSELGVGSTFRIYLPVTTERETEAGGPAPVTLGALPHGSETVLLVEDDVAVRTITASVLKRLGYRVIAVEDADAALALAGDPMAQIDLVLSDVVMPGMSGPELVEHLRATRPAICAILMSGYAGDAIASRGVEASDLPFLEKPFSVAALATTLRTVLDAP